MTLDSPSIEPTAEVLRAWEVAKALVVDGNFAGMSKLIREHPAILGYRFPAYLESLMPTPLNSRRPAGDFMGMVPQSEIETAKLAIQFRTYLDRYRIGAISYELEESTGERLPDEVLLSMDAYLDAQTWQKVASVVEEHDMTCTDASLRLLTLACLSAAARHDGTTVSRYLPMWEFLHHSLAWSVAEALAREVGPGKDLVDAQFLAIDRLLAGETPGWTVEALRRGLDHFGRLADEADTLEAPKMTVAAILCAAAEGAAGLFIAEEGHPDLLERALDWLDHALAMVPASVPVHNLILGYKGLLLESKGLAWEAFDAYSAAALATPLFVPFFGTLERRATELGRHLMFRLPAADSGDRETHLFDRTIRLQKLMADWTLPEMRTYALWPLGESLVQRYRRRGDLADLNAAIELSADPAPGRGADWLTGRHGYWLYHRYLARGDQADLDAATHHLQHAVAMTDSDVVKAVMLDHFGCASRHQYLLTADERHLEEGLAASREAVGIRMPDGEPAIRSTNLCAMLVDRYRLRGQSADLDEAISRLRAMSADDVYLEHNVASAMLGIALVSRYRRTGDLDDLDAAVDLLSRAVEETPESAPERSNAETNLASVVMERFGRTGDHQDADRIVVLCRSVSRRDEGGSPVRLSNRCNLATALFLRRDEDWFTEVMEILGAVVASTPASSYEGTRARSLLVAALAARAEEVAEMAFVGTDPEVSDERVVDAEAAELLARALATARDLAENAPSGLAEMSITLHNLGLMMTLNEPETPDSPQEQELTLVFRRACELGLEDSVRHVLSSSNVWSWRAAARGAWEEAAEAAEFGIRASRLLSRTQLLRDQKHENLGLAGQLAARAAYGLAKCGKLEEAIAAIESGRAIVYGEALERDPSLGRLAAEHPDLHARYLAAAARRQMVAQLHDAVHPRLYSDTQRVDHNAIATAKAEFAGVVRDVQAMPGYERFDMAPAYADVATHANGDQPVVYLIATLQGGAALIVGDGPGVVWLPELTLTKLGEMTEGYLTAMRDRAFDRHAWFLSLEETLCWLGDTVMGPLRSALSRADIVSLVPCGQLALLPVHAATIRDGDDVCHVTDLMRVQYRPNARSVRVSDLGPTAPVTIITTGFPSDPMAREASLIAGLWVAEYDEVTTIGDGEQVSKTELKQLLERSAIHHFATHSRAELTDPLSSSILLPDGQTLTSREVLNLRLDRTSLTFLSSCESAVGTPDLPDEVINISSSFTEAGVAGVIATLWPVDDFATMLAAYRTHHLMRTENLPGVEALRQAQIWLRDSDTAAKHAALGSPVATGTAAERLVASSRLHAHPYYWAAFTYTGR